MKDRRTFIKTVGAGTAVAFGAGGLIGSARAQQLPTVSLSFSPAKVIFDWSGSTDYMTHKDGMLYGSWADGPMNPYRRKFDDVMRAVVPHSENRTMYLIHGSMAIPSLSPLSPMTMNSPRYSQMASMDMRHWLFSVFNVNEDKAVAIAHSENYTELLTGQSGLSWPNEASSNFKWFNSLSLFKSAPRTSNHDYFSYAFDPVAFMGTITHSDQHLIIHPAPPQYGRPGKAANYGFFHPSNMIEDNGYVYVFAQHIPATQNPTMTDPNGSPSSPAGKAGPVLLRCMTSMLEQTDNPANRNGHYWEIFNASGAWQYITRWDWADASIAEAPIKPYVFYKNNEPTRWMANMAMAQAVRKIGSKFVVLGVQYAGVLRYSYCASLANPLELETHLNEFGQGHPFGGAFDLQSAAYMSFFDPYDQDCNYRNVEQDSSRVMLVFRALNNWTCYEGYSITFSGF